MTDTANTIATQVATFLTQHPTLPFCAVCLAHELGIDPRLAHQVFTVLDGLRFCTVRRLCVRCLRRETVIYARPTPTMDTATEEGR